MKGESLRQAVRADIPGIQRVRHSVRENRLTSCVITDEEVAQAIEVTGRGWVVEVDGEVRAFAVGNGETGNIWALFVEPGYERRGYGRRLQERMLAWLWSRGLKRLWLSTQPGTRAERFYEASGWLRRDLLPSGEVLFEHLAGYDSAMPTSGTLATQALRRMLANGPLMDLPKSRTDQELLFALAAARFEAGRVYAEKEVNELLRAWLELTSAPFGIDHVTLRRCLVDWRFLGRDKAGTGYVVAEERIRQAIADDARRLEPAEIIAEVQRARAERKREQASRA